LEEEIMNILIVDPSSERRALVDDALSWVSDQYVLQQAQSLMEAKEQLRGEEFQLVIVGPELPEDTFAALVFLRGWLPHTPLLTYTKMSRLIATCQPACLIAAQTWCLTSACRQRNWDWCFALISPARAMSTNSLPARLRRLLINPPSVHRASRSLPSAD
jgi:CheY-like chemotaxis protein